jgi:hypothetical protein
MIDARRLLRPASLFAGLAVCGFGAQAAAMNNPAPAAAGTPTPDATPLTPQERSLQGFGIHTPECLEWSDSCSVCLRDEAGAIHCSTPGIACQPETIVCRREKAK